MTPSIAPNLSDQALVSADRMALPSARDEAWRYADRAAVATIWPLAPSTPRRIEAGEPVVETLYLGPDAPAVCVQALDLGLAKDARFTLAVVVAGGRYRRIALDVTMGEGARFDLRAVLLACGDEGGVAGEAPTLEIVSTISHQAPGAVSQQSVRSIAGRGGTASYLGKVAVARGAQKTDSTQSLRAVLLDRSATANARPELEIYADDVKCAHGAAVGTLDDDALFYLQSRGLPPAEARRLLLDAFVAGAFTGLPEDLADAATGQAMGWLESMT